MTLRRFLVRWGRFFTPPLLLSTCLFSQEPVEGIVAVVGQHPILRSDLIQLLQMAALERQLDPARDAAAIDQLGMEILQQMIQQKVLVEMAVRDSVEVGDSEVDRAVDQHVQSLVARAGSAGQLEQLFGKPLRHLKRDLWPEAKEQLLAERYRQKLSISRSPSRKDVGAFFAAAVDSIGEIPSLYYASHLLKRVRPGAASRRSSRVLLEGVREKIVSGEQSFEDAAQKLSEDPGSSANGGSLGIVSRGVLVPAFEQAAFSAQVGVLSPIVETEFGYHILEVTERVGEKVAVRHILVSPDVTEADEDSAYRASQLLVDSLALGISWESLVSNHSDDLATGGAAGLLGWISSDTAPTSEVGQALALLQVGTASPPIRSSEGYHIVLVHKVRPGGRVSLETHYPELEQMVRSQQSFSRLTSKLADEAGIYVNRLLE